jgi:hypothetical protein
VIALREESSMSGAKRDAPTFTADIDGAIIRGFLDDRRALFRKLSRLGFSRGAVIDRARQLGLSEQFVKRCSVGDPDVALRTCLRCGERFLSVGFQNRLCNRCKSKK